MVNNPNTNPNPNQTTHEEIMRALYAQTKRVAVGYLLAPNYLDEYYSVENVRLTPERAAEVKDLLAAMLKDQHHNPQTTRDQIMLDIRHDLGYLSYRDATHYSIHPQCFVDYLMSKYQRTAGTYIQTITNAEINSFQSVINAVIECNHNPG